MAPIPGGDDRYRFLADALSQFVWTLDRTGVAEYCNPCMLEYLGLSLIEVAAGEWQRTIHPDDLAGGVARREEGLRTLEPFEFEMRIRRASDGEYRWHLIRARPFVDTRPGQWGWLLTGVDIDSRKTAEQTHALLASIVKSSSEAIIGLDPLGLITSWNPAAANLFGYSSAEAIGKPITLLTPPDTQPEPKHTLARVLAGERPGMEETVRYHKDTRRLTVQVTVTLIRDETGRPAGAFETVRDVTEQRRMERDLAAADEWLRLVQRAVRAGAWEVESKSRAMYWSPELLDLFGLPEGAPATMETFASVVHPDDFEYVSEGIRESTEKHVPLSLQFRVLAGTEFRWVSAFGTVVGTGSSARIVGISIDSTQMRKTEEAARLESIGRLAGGVAHDYNNLLAGIMGGASLVAEILPPDHSARPMVDLVIRSSERAAALTKQLLAYSGRGTFLLRRTNLSKCAADVFSQLQESIPPNVSLTLQTARELPWIEADESQLQEAVRNLFTNAVEAIGETRGYIEVRTGVETLGPGSIASRFQRDVPPGTYVYLEVEDSGTGMTPEVKERIFEPFFTTRFMGRGLGLAALQGIVRAHRGAIEVESQPGQGSTFRIFLPAAPADEPENTAKPQPEQTGTLILVIDDEEAVRRVVQASLDRAGYNVVTAQSGRRGVEIFEERRDQISLVILDVSMPNVAGAEVHARLLEAGIQVPVVIASGYPEPLAMHEIGSDHVAGFLEKPFNVRELCGLVESLIGPARVVEIS